MNLPSWPKFSNERIINLGLERIEKFLDHLGNPQRKIPNIIHVAGTNGKGSTIAFLRNLFEHQGYSVNCYSSPHLISFNERIRIKGKLISDDYLEQLSDYCDSVSQKYPDLSLSFFEGTTILAILAFASNPADINIFETGLGGRLDATNIFKDKLATIITPISYDHQEFLGTDLKDIAGEKAGIITGKSAVYVAKQQSDIYDIFVSKAAEYNADIFLYNRDYSYKNMQYCDNKLNYKLPCPDIPLKGEHQKENLALALKVFFEITSYQNMDISLANTYWPARISKIDLLSPYKERYDKLNLWLDGGHNIQAARMLADWADENDISYIIMAINRSKDFTAYLDQFRNFSGKIFFTEMTIYEDCYKVSDLVNISNSHLIKAPYNNVLTALDEVNNILEQQKNILLCGSLYFAGEVMQKLGQKIF